MFKKETWDAVKAFFDALKVPLVLLVLVLIYLYPYKIKNFLRDAGYRVVDVNLLGVRLQEAADDLEGVGDKLAQVTPQLAERDRLLREIADTSQEPPIRDKARAMIDGGDRITASALATAERAFAQAVEIGASLQVATQAPAAPAAVGSGPGGGGYLVVFGADLDIAPALDEVQRVQRALPDEGIRFALFRKGNFYRSAAVFDSRAARDQQARAIGATAGRSVESVALDRWCPAAAPIAGTTPVPVFQC